MGFKVTNFRKVWHAEHSDGSHEIVEVVASAMDDHFMPYWVGYGRFTTDLYDEADHKWAIESFGLQHFRYVSDYDLAEALFECNMADFDVWQYDTEAEALAKAEEIVGE